MTTARPIVRVIRDFLREVEADSVDLLPVKDRAHLARALLDALAANAPGPALDAIQESGYYAKHIAADLTTAIGATADGDTLAVAQFGARIVRAAVDYLIGIYADEAEDAEALLRYEDRENARIELAEARAEFDPTGREA